MSRFQLLPFLSVHAILLSGRQPPLPLARMRETVPGVRKILGGGVALRPAASSSKSSIESSLTAPRFPLSPAELNDSIGSEGSSA